MDGKSLVLASLVFGALLVAAAPSPAEEEPASWYTSAVAAGEIDDAAYRKRMTEIVDDVNATRREFADLGPLEWDREKSEGHFRHARWLLHHMKEPWNSGGVTDFHDESAGSEFFHLEGRSAAKVSLIAVMYLKRRKPFQPCDRWLPTVGKRFPWLLRSATTVYAGYAEGVVPKGADFAGDRWGVVVLATDADFKRSRARENPANRAPVVCPRDGAKGVPLELLREAPDIVPPELDGKAGKKTKHGFPLTFSFFGGQALLSGAAVTLVRLEEVEVEEEKPKRRRPGSRGSRKKKAKKSKKRKTEIIETSVEYFLSTPLEKPLRKKPGTNANSIVVIPHRPLEPGMTYRATLTCRIGGGNGAGKPKDVELVTTFTTAAATKK